MKAISHREVFFCSAASRYFKESLAATAANSKAYILVEHSDPFPGKVIEGHFERSWLQGLQKLAKSVNGKLLLVRNKKSNYRDCKIIFVDCVQGKYFFVQTTIALAHTVDVTTHINSPATIWLEDPFFLVCTNGKKDKCCAKFGFPVFKFFESFNADVEVWESTHVGGDRFAANVVCMPFGIYYGHVAVEDVGHIMVRTLLRKIYKKNYRGLSKRSFFEQSVEYYLREHFHNYDIDFNITMKLLSHVQDDYTVQVAINNMGVFMVKLQRQVIAYPHYLTCTSTKQEDIAKYVLKDLQQIL